MNFTQALAARGLDATAVLKAARAQLTARRRAQREAQLLIPGVCNRYRVAVSRSRFSESAERTAARAEIAALESCATSTELVREYVRTFDRINNLVHVVIDFPPRFELGEDDSDAEPNEAQS